jgi:hypothetical protein
VDPAASPITLTATITAGKFVGWSGDCSGTTPTATLIVPPGASSLSCTLVVSGTQSGLLPVNIILSSANSHAATAYVTSAPAGINQTNCSLAGTSAGCTVLLQSGTTYTLTPTLNAGTTFFGWQGDCVPAGGNTATLNMASTRTSFACTLVVNGP